MLSILIKPTPATVTVVRRNQTTSLLAVLHSSTPPLTWQLDLEKNPNFTLELREKEGEWDLGYTPVSGAFAVVAHFDERRDAEFAYASIHKALRQPSSGFGLAGLAKLFGVLVLVGVLLAVLAQVLPILMPEIAQTEGTVPTAALQEDMATPVKSRLGVPVSADELLSQRP